MASATVILVAIELTIVQHSTAFVDLAHGLAHVCASILEGGT